ncbi:hypothetical protein ACQKCH_12655 [Nubsella zeaxanthinifaciens]|uniref:hypothetical protein n=1 Tax=Nubsella zeaxanthinifaciens TaxID=392412 RepID=UPI003D0447E9
MEIIEINGISIDLDSKQSYYEIDDFYFGEPMIKVSLIGLSEEKKLRTMFIGFPIVSGIKNIPLYELRKQKVGGNNAMDILNMIVSHNYDYDYFFISTAGIDPIGIEFFKKLPMPFETLDKRIFIIGALKMENNFVVKYR